jgi:hypothetical protein
MVDISQKDPSQVLMENMGMLDVQATNPQYKL